MGFIMYVIAFGHVFLPRTNTPGEWDSLTAMGDHGKCERLYQFSALKDAAKAEIS
jgi:hypothetical protein